MAMTSTRTRSGHNRTLILLTMSLGVLIAQIDTSVVNLAVKQIGEGLHAGVSVLQWVVDAYNLVYASLLLTAGGLADIYGRRRIFVLGIVLFTIGSLVCGLAPNAAVLVLGRGIAGLGAALEIPTSLAILTVAYPDTRERTRALGLWASCNGLAFVIGPTVGGVLVDAAGWRSIFLLIVPICIVALALALTAVPESKDPKGRTLDLPGQGLAIAALGALSLGVIEGPHWGWASPHSILSFAIAIAATALFFRLQARSDSGLVPLSILQEQRVLGQSRHRGSDDVRHVRHAVLNAALFAGRSRRQRSGRRLRIIADVGGVRHRVAVVGAHRQPLRAAAADDRRHGVHGRRLVHAGADPVDRQFRC